MPALLHCADFRLDAELRWGPRREPRSFHLDSGTGLVSHQLDSGTYVPAEIPAFVERFRQVAPAWELTESTDLIELGREGVWVPDYRAVHKATGTDVFIEVLGFWKKSSLERLLRLLPNWARPGSCWRSPNDSRSTKRQSRNCKARSFGSRKSPAHRNWQPC